MEIETQDMLVETKLTKTEAIDLLVEEMKSELEAKRAEATARKKSLSNWDISELENDLLDRGTREVGLGYYEEEMPGKVKVSINLEIPSSKLPPDLRAQINKYRAAAKEESALSHSIHELDGNKNKVRNAILRTMLENSEQGQKFLKLLNGLKLKASPKLLQLVSKK
jgi:hypothetical protein